MAGHCHNLNKKWLFLIIIIVACVFGVFPYMCWHVITCQRSKYGQQTALSQCPWNIHLRQVQHHTHKAAIIHSYRARNRHVSLLRCLNTTLMYELAVMCEVKYKDGWCRWRLMVGGGREREGGGVGREGEVRESGCPEWFIQATLRTTAAVLNTGSGVW